MRICVSATESAGQGVPPLDISIEAGWLAAARFPSPGTILSLEGPSGLPCVHARWTGETVRDTEALGALLGRGSRWQLAATSLGDSGDLRVADELHPAQLFYGRSRAGEPVAGCAIAIPFWSPLTPPFPTLVLLLGVPGTRATVRRPEAVAEHVLLAPVLASLRLRLPGVAPQELDAGLRERPSCFEEALLDPC
jgi:hypothetical protein